MRKIRSSDHTHTHAHTHAPNLVSYLERMHVLLHQFVGTRRVVGIIITAHAAVKGTQGRERLDDRASVQQCRPRCRGQSGLDHGTKVLLLYSYLQRQRGGSCCSVSQMEDLWILLPTHGKNNGVPVPGWSHVQWGWPYLRPTVRPTHSFVNEDVACLSEGRMRTPTGTGKYLYLALSWARLC